ncbi:1,4-alpha-glucan branching protein GlgB [Clostridium sp.]|uniref:1,4-alpha-glucan branching protein GlgB n=1 Tax=Clostridium sp. TaxID=1506 RepID=UPI001B495157|nr:1,4-alpha-glucan branching protein GlgB [Clostridium sp.]MBP3917293.1 1,4-alpha-glucan branching protein GlgB [Clostridium sp.]
MDMYGFYSGKVFDAYKYLGAHVKENQVTFRTFAPNALKIELIGEFNDWNRIEMKRTDDDNFFECSIENAKPGMLYKYKIYNKNGGCVDHCDPYGFGMEVRPNTASIIRDLDKYKFNDDEWIKRRSDCKDKPLNIYEVHLGSWRKKSDNTWYTYREISELLIPYVKEYGYNYIEIMPLSEHPCDESWGYQNTGFFSPTSRYGTAIDLMYFIDKCHENNIGVIMDFVPVHFAIDEFALANYDGTSLYEYPYEDIEMSQWGSKNFIHSRGEVRSFLQSAANYWLEEYHFDGLRVDALSNIIYWQGNSDRGENKGAIEFIKGMNQGLKALHPTAILAAEDSTAYPKVTEKVENGGLGFDYKWDMGWMNDTLEYFKMHPYDRKRAYHKLTFSMMYFYSEHFLMPLSHDEVVHGKATIIQKMHGEYEDKFKQVRALYMYMYAHPGKKLNFMGNEIGQFREWNEKREQDWDILNYPMHNNFNKFMKKLNNVYLEYPALYKNDYKYSGFKWIDCQQEDKCIYVFERICEEQRIIAIFNFSNEEQKNYELKVDSINKMRLIIDSNSDDLQNNEVIYIVRAINKKYKDKIDESKEKFEDTISIDMPAFSARYYLVEK